MCREWKGGGAKLNKKKGRKSKVTDCVLCGKEGDVNYARRTDDSNKRILKKQNKESKKRPGRVQEKTKDEMTRPRRIKKVFDWEQGLSENDQCERDVMLLLVGAIGQLMVKER